MLFCREIEKQSLSKGEKREAGLTYASDLDFPNSELPDDAKVVIVGGGAQGAAIAYKLAQRGKKTNECNA